MRCAHVFPVRRYFRAHSARYGIQAQMHGCTNLLPSGLVRGNTSIAADSDRDQFRQRGETETAPPSSISISISVSLRGLGERLDALLLGYFLRSACVTSRTAPRAALVVSAAYDRKAAETGR